MKERRLRMSQAHVVCCTCIGSGSDLLDNTRYDCVLVDEATQATEPAVLVPLTRGCTQLVLVGDHCQLPPTVVSPTAQSMGLGVPLFSRLVNAGVVPKLLDTQYRMHPCIAQFPSDLFYGGTLKNGVSAGERRPLAGFPWPCEEFPVAFVGIHSEEVDDGVSKCNPAEAAAACDAVASLLQGGCRIPDIAVVTPYAAQVRLLKRLTRNLVGNTPPFVEVSSTDGFQGREKEAVVFSAVRSNEYGEVGFVSNWRRVNVSFTRARRALIVIGNDATLRRGDPYTWSPWLAWADAHGIHMDKPGIVRGRYDPEQLRRIRRPHPTMEESDPTDNGNNVPSPTTTSTSTSMTNVTKTTAQELQQFSNMHGCWDDSDDDDSGVSGSDDDDRKLTITPSSSCNQLDTKPQDAWDL